MSQHAFVYERNRIKKHDTFYYTALTGMKEICNHVQRSETIVLQWIRELGFPAKKIGGMWESDINLIDEWRKKQIQSSK